MAYPEYLGWMDRMPDKAKKLEETGVTQVPDPREDYINSLRQRRALVPQQEQLMNQYLTDIQNPPSIQGNYIPVHRRILGGLMNLNDPNLGRAYKMEPYMQRLQDYTMRTGGEAKALSTMSDVEANRAYAEYQRASALQKLREKPIYPLGAGGGYVPQTGELIAPFAKPFSAPGSAVYNPSTGQFEQNPYQTSKRQPQWFLPPGSTAAQPKTPVPGYTENGIPHLIDGSPLPEGYIPYKPTTGMRGSFMTPYAAIRFMEDVTRYRPDLAELVPQFLQQAGFQNIPPEAGDLPPGQPYNAAGSPIGTMMPESPTVTTRNRGQLAQGMLKEIQRVRKMLTDYKDVLGPAMGRWNQFMTGVIGGSDDPNYAKYEELRTAMIYLTSGAGKVHLGTQVAVKDFEKAAQVGKMSPEILNAFLNEVEKWSRTYAEQGKGKPPKDLGARIKMKGQDGRTYLIPTDKVEQAKKDGFSPI